MHLPSPNKINNILERIPNLPRPIKRSPIKNIRMVNVLKKPNPIQIIKRMDNTQQNKPIFLINNLSHFLRIKLKLKIYIMLY